VARLRLETEQAHITTYGLDGRVLAYARDSRKAKLAVKYFKHQLELVNESEVLVVPMTAYDLVLGFPWFRTNNPEIDWEAGRLLSLRAKCQPDITGEASISGPDIQTLSATAFGDLCASDTVSHAFCLTLGECQGLLGATSGGHLKYDGELTLWELNARAGAAAVVAAEERKRDLNDCYWLAETTKRRRTAGTGTRVVREPKDLDISDS